MFRDFTTTTTS